VPLTLIEAFHSRGVPVTQVYGSTETGPVSIVLRPEEAMANAGRVGRPALGVQVSLADDGEILLKAPNLLRAYHRSTVQAFDDAGWFHTGDLARLHPDGLYEVTGRSKELIISGGENIHPAEIENLAALWPGVAAVAVVGLPDERWGEVPVLALVAQAGADPDLAGLRAFLGARLARFKQPGRIVLLPSLPQTALGKVQRERLVGLLGGTVD
jgi:fatty-acyl-CoA synthase